MQRGPSHGIRLVRARIPLQQPVEHMVVVQSTCKMQGCHAERVQGLVHWKICVHYCVNVLYFTVDDGLPDNLFGLVELIQHGVAAVIDHILKLLSFDADE